MLELLLQDQSQSQVRFQFHLEVPFVISDTGKTLLESADELKVYCDSEAAIDVSLSILTGVN